jgi:hypothetical protein
VRAGTAVIASALSISLRFRSETRRLKFFPRSRFLLQFRSLVMFWRVPHRRAAEQPGAAFSPTPESARSAVCYGAGANRGRTVERRGVVLRMVLAPDALPVRCDPIHLRIFDAFVTTKPQGTGLDLPIARTILESYGGDISA